MTTARFISYLCDRCKNRSDWECGACDRGSRFVEAKRGPDIDYTRYMRKDVELTQQVISKMRVSFEIKNVIFNDPATIVMWADGTKTVVKCQPGDIYSPELGLAMAISKKALGNKGNYNEVFKQWLPEEKKEKSRTIIGKVTHFDKTEDGICATVETTCSAFDGNALFEAINNAAKSAMSISFNVKE